MKVSSKGIEFLKIREGFDPKCKVGDSWKAHYDTIAGIWDMPYGITKDLEGESVKKNDIWTDSYVNEVFTGMVEQFEKQINRYIGKCELSENQYDAIFSFVWNIGIGNFSTSTALKRILAKEYDKVPEAMMLFNGVVSKVKQPNGTIKKVKIPIKGIINRRNFEIALWSDADYGV